jgi:hypothetical protein
MLDQCVFILATSYSLTTVENLLIRKNKPTKKCRSKFKENFEVIQCHTNLFTVIIEELAGRYEEYIRAHQISSEFLGLYASLFRHLCLPVRLYDHAAGKEHR